MKFSILITILVLFASELECKNTTEASGRQGLFDFISDLVSIPIAVADGALDVVNAGMNGTLTNK